MEKESSVLSQGNKPFNNNFKDVEGGGKANVTPSQAITKWLLYYYNNYNYNSQAKSKEEINFTRKTMIKVLTGISNHGIVKVSNNMGQCAKVKSAIAEECDIDNRSFYKVIKYFKNLKMIKSYRELNHYIDMTDRLTKQANDKKHTYKRKARYFINWKAIFIHLEDILEPNTKYLKRLENKQTNKAIKEEVEEEFKKDLESILNTKNATTKTKEMLLPKPYNATYIKDTLNNSLDDAVSNDESNKPNKEKNTIFNNKKQYKANANSLCTKDNNLDKISHIIDRLYNRYNKAYILNGKIEEVDKSMDTFKNLLNVEDSLKNKVVELIKPYMDKKDEYFILIDLSKVLQKDGFKDIIFESNKAKAVKRSIDRENEDIKMLEEFISIKGIEINNHKALNIKTNSTGFEIADSVEEIIRDIGISISDNRGNNIRSYTLLNDDNSVVNKVLAYYLLQNEDRTKRLNKINLKDKNKDRDKDKNRMFKNDPYDRLINGEEEESDPDDPFSIFDDLFRDRRKVRCHNGYIPKM